jgi:hypothetical protein
MIKAKRKRRRIIPSVVWLIVGTLLAGMISALTAESAVEFLAGLSVGAGFVFVGAALMFVTQRPFGRTD